MQLEKLLLRIREKDTQAVKELFDQKGIELYQACYDALQDHGLARNRAKLAFETILSRIRSLPEGTVTEQLLDEWVISLSKGAQRESLYDMPTIPISHFAASQELKRSPYLAAAPAPQPVPEAVPQPEPVSVFEAEPDPDLQLEPLCQPEPEPVPEQSTAFSALDQCLAQFPEQPLPPDTQRYLSDAEAKLMETGEFPLLRQDPPAAPQPEPIPAFQPEPELPPVSDVEKPAAAPSVSTELPPTGFPPVRPLPVENPEQYLDLEDEDESDPPKAANLTWLLVLLILLLLVILWGILGMCMSLRILPFFDLGYSWFNSNIFPLFW